MRLDRAASPALLPQAAEYLTSSEVVDLTTGRASLGPIIPGGTNHGCAVVRDGRIYLVRASNAEGQATANFLSIEGKRKLLYTWYVWPRAKAAVASHQQSQASLWSTPLAYE